MAISNLFKTGNSPVISMEVFPPKKDSPIEVVNRTLEAITEYSPAFVSVTYGAGGSNAGRHIETARSVQNLVKCPVLGHLTCVGATPDMINNALDGFREIGMTDVLALRGDIPEGMSKDEAFRHFAHATDLLSSINERGGFDIACACYPEMHFESKSADDDMSMLKLKVETGAGLLISQLFFDNNAFFDFMNRVRKNLISCPVTAGIMPIQTSAQILKMTSLCGASVPAGLSRLIARYGQDQESFSEAALEYTCHQVEELIKNGVDGIHLYTMNRPDYIGRILANLGLI